MVIRAGQLGRLADLTPGFVPVQPQDFSWIGGLADTVNAGRQKAHDLRQDAATGNLLTQGMDAGVFGGGGMGGAPGAGPMPFSPLGGLAGPQPQQAGPTPGPMGGRFDDAFGGYIHNAMKAESGGNPNAKNPRSSATGLFQFTSGTWNDLARKYPGLGLTPDGRTDPGQQQRAMMAFTRDNAQGLQSAGIPVNGGSLYAAHFLGLGGARSVLTAPDNAAVSSLLPPEVTQANPFLQGMSVGQFKQWAAQKGGAGGAAPQNGQQAISSAMAFAPGGLQTAGAGQPQPMPQGGYTDAQKQWFREAVRNPQTRPVALELLKQRMAPPEAYTLSPGQVRFEGGRMVAAVPGKPEAGPASVQEYTFARQQGYQGSYQDFITEKARAGRTQVTTNVGQSEVGTIPPGFELVTDPQTGARSMRQIPGGPAALEAEAAERAGETKEGQQQTWNAIVNEDIDRAISTIDGGLLPTTGFIGNALSETGSTGANNLRALLGTIKANAGFDRLQAMRDSSPTGGALGQVSERELAFLQSTIGNLEQSQTAQQLKYNLNRLKGIYQNMLSGKRAYDGLLDGGAQQGGAQQGGGATPQPGQVEDGHVFMGGDPADPNNWRPQDQVY